VTGLSGDHRATLEKILRHPASGNIEWRQVRSLLEAVGATTEEHNGKVRVTLGGENRGVATAAREGHRRSDDRRPPSHVHERRAR
jgi:hypothetical protein